MDASPRQFESGDNDRFNPYASSQVVEVESKSAEDDYRLSHPIPLNGRGSLETMVRAIWDAYGLKQRLRFWLWTIALGALAIGAFVADWNWWWPALCLAIIVALFYFGLYLPARIERHVRDSAAGFDLRYRGEVAEAGLSFEKETADGQWVAAFPDEPVIVWSELQLDRLGANYLLFVRRKNKQAWFLSLPRQLFASDDDWRRMVEFAERRLMRPLVAPRCAKCRKRLPRSELRPMPWGLRLAVGHAFTALGTLVGVPPAVYCSDCWTTVYGRQIATLIAVVMAIAGVVAAIVFVTLA